MKILLGIFIATFLLANEYGKIDMHGGKSDKLYKNNLNNNGFSSLFSKKIKKEKTLEELLIEEKKLKELKEIKNSEKLNGK